MDINIHPAEQLPDVTIVAITGRIDSYTLERVTEEVQSLIRIGSIKLICNLVGVDFVSGVGLRAFLKAIQDCRKSDGDFKLCGLQPAVAKIFKLAGFTDIAEIYPSEAAALVAFGGTPGPGAFDQTMVAGGGDPLGQTMVAPGAGAGFEKTMVGTPGGAKGFDATMIDPGQAGKGFDATMVEGQAGMGFEKTMLDAPAGGGREEDPMTALREKLKTVAGTQGDATKGDAMAKLREKLQAAGEAGKAGAAVNDQAYQTVMTRIEEIEGTLVLPEEPAPVPAAASAPAPGPVAGAALPSVNVITARIPTELKSVEPISQLTAAVGTLVGINKMELVKFGVAVVEVLRAIVRHAPKANVVTCTVRSAPKEVSLALQPDGDAFDIFHVLRPQMESQINTPEQAREWLEKLVSAVEVETTGAGAPQITLTKSI